MIVPTVGRVVHYRPAKGDFDAMPDNDQPCAAIVAYVHDPRLVNLSVFDANGVPHSRTSVTLVQDGDPLPNEGAGGHAEWMPFQKGQAQKTEALEKRIADSGAEQKATA